MKKISSPFLIIKKSIDLFTEKNNLFYFVKLYLPAIVIPLLSVGIMQIPFFAGNQDKIWFLWLARGLFLLANLAFIFVSLSGIIGWINVLDGKNPPIGAIYKKSLQKYWIFLLLSVILFIINTFGFIFLLIPGIIFSTWYIFSKYLMIDKGYGIKQSLFESRLLVKGLFWKIFVRLLVFGLFFVLCLLISYAIPYGVGVLIYYLSGALFILPTILLYKELLEGKNSSIV